MNIGSFNYLLKNTTSSLKNIIIRHGHRMRGKPPGEARSLKQRLDELNYKDPEISFRVDIGLPLAVQSRKVDVDKRAARSKSIAATKQFQETVPLEDIKSVWRETSAPFQTKAVAEHYNVFQDLFGDAFFYPTVFLDVYYQQQDGATVPVHRGNIVKPSSATNPPQVSYQSEPEQLWSLILTNPDGHFTEQDMEYVHWFVGNIPGDRVSKGETIVDYLQPFPARGTGYHRLVFVLYKQEERIDFTKWKRDSPCLELQDRTFSTLSFYRELQDHLTPGGLAFCQCDWDPSLTDFYHKVLNMKEPIFEYDHDKQYVRPQEWFPIRQPFNIYMDRYRDPKVVSKQYFMEKMKTIHPFVKPEKPFPYPNALRIDDKVPSWLKLKTTRDRLGFGRINYETDEWTDV